MALVEGGRLVTRGSSDNIKRVKKNKSFYIAKMNDQTLGGITWTELDIVTRLHHPNIIHAKSITTDPFAIIYPVGEEIVDFRSKPFEYLRYALRALEFLHENGIVYLDMRIGRLIKVDGEVKLTGFTLSAQSPSALSEVDRNLIPEDPPETDLSKNSDVWGLGMMVLRYYKTDSIEDLPIKALQLLVSLMTRTTDRPSVRKILGMRFFNESPIFSIYIPPLYQVTPKKSIRSGLLEVDKFVRDTLPDEDVQVLFLALDLYYRCGKSDIPTITSVALSTLTGKSIDHDPSNETHIITQTKGQINVDLLYRSSRDEDDLRANYKIFFDHDVLRLSHIEPTIAFTEQPQILIRDF